MTNIILRKHSSAFRMLILLFSLSPVIVSSAQEMIASKIREVTVFASGARIYRTTRLMLHAGENEIILENLSNQLDENSIEVQYPGQGQIASIKYELNSIKKLSPGENALRYKSQYDSARIRLEMLVNEKNSLTGQLRVLEANQKIGINEKTIYTEEMEDWLETYRKNFVAISNRITRLNEQEKDLREAVVALSDELNRRGGAVKQSSGQIVIHLSATAAEASELNFSYYVNNAGWHPQYNLRAGKLTDPLKVDYDAVVFQQTGEAWDNVRLSLSTGNPAMGGNKPEVLPWFLYIQQPPMLYRTSMKDATMSAPAVEKLSANDEAAQSYAPVPNQTVNFATTVQFQIAQRYSIASGGSGEVVRIQQFNLPATYEYATAPKLSEDAFLQAQVTGYEDFNLLPGEANLFLEGVYLGKSNVDPSVTNDTLTFGFGRDKKIIIKRERLKGTSKKSLFGSSKSETFSYETSVRNTKQGIVQITVEDQVPLSQTKDIEVSLNDQGGAIYNPETGKLSWKLNLQPGEIKKLKFTYQVKYPKNKIIQNL